MVPSRFSFTGLFLFNLAVFVALAASISMGYAKETPKSKTKPAPFTTDQKLKLPARAPTSVSLLPKSNPAPKWTLPGTKEFRFFDETPTNGLTGNGYPMGPTWILETPKQ